MMNFKIALIALVLFCCNKKATAQQHDFTKLDAWVADHASQMGGRAILVVYKNGQLIYNHSIDQMTNRQKMIDRFVAKKQGATPDLNAYTLTSRQPIASCSKWLSAALVMTFVDEGKLKLTDTVGKYLPVLTKHGKGKITISECLAHLTGIKAPELKENVKDVREASSMDGVMETMANMPMEGEPGKVFHYSNEGLQICGAILEKISGKSFETLFAERIARPVGMKNTDFGHAKVALPAGGAFSTPEDYLNFLVMIMNKGVINGKRILSEASVAAMQVNRITPDVKIGYSPAEAGNFGYGYGEWMVGEQAVSSPGLFGSYPWVDNKNHYAAFLMTFYLGSNGRHERYVELMKLTTEMAAGF